MREFWNSIYNVKRDSDEENIDYRREKNKRLKIPKDVRRIDRSNADMIYDIPNIPSQI